MNLKGWGRVCVYVCVCVGGVFEITGPDLEQQKDATAPGHPPRSDSPWSWGGSAGARSENKHTTEDAARDTSNGGLRL